MGVQMERLMEEFEETNMDFDEEMTSEEEEFEELIDTTELLEIREEGYAGEPEAINTAGHTVIVCDDEKMLDVIEQAEREEWKTMYIILDGCARIPAEIGSLTCLEELQIDKKKANSVLSLSLPAEDWKSDPVGKTDIV